MVHSKSDSGKGWKEKPNHNQDESKEAQLNWK